jgi:hypothetical protein
LKFIFSVTIQRSKDPTNIQQNRHKRQMKLQAFVAIIGFLIGLYFWFNRRLNEMGSKYQEFRANFQSKHDDIDSKFHHKDIQVGKTSWHFVDEGPEDGPVILFLHGLPESWYSWHYVLPLIDKRFRLLAIDMKGYGRTISIDLNYDWNHVADEVLELCKR